jgi:hypothetical protein
MDSEGPRRPDLTSALVVVALVLVTAVAFLPVFGNGFVGYDDDAYLNATVQQGLSPATVRWAFATSHTGNWHPLTWLSHLLDASLFGLRPAGHHAVSLLLHAAAAALLYLLVRGMTGRVSAAWLAAALFAVHPLHVESVAWAAERKDVLSGLFFMLTLLAWLRYVRSGRNRAGPDPRCHEGGITARSRRYLLSLALFALGLMAKPMLVTLPFVLLLLDWWPLGRLAAADGGHGRRGWRGRAPLVLEKIPFLALAAGSSIATFLVQQAAGSTRAADFYPFGVRLGNAVTAMAAYIGKTVLPVGLSVVYPHPRVFPAPGRFALAAAILLGCSAAAWLARRSRPHLFVGWWWFAGMLVPVIGLVQVGAQALADRYTYLPLVGIFVALAVEGERCAGRGSRRRVVSAGMAAGVVVVCGILTFRQAAVWRTTVTLFTHAVAVTDDNWMAQMNLGIVLTRMGRVEEGREHFKEAFRIRPDYGRTHRRLGIP